MSTSNRASLTKASQLDVEEAVTTTFQNVEAKSRTASMRNKPATDALDALEKAVNVVGDSSGQQDTERKKHSWADVVRKGAGLGVGGGGTSRSRSMSGSPPRHVRRVSEAQDLLKAAGVHGPRRSSLTKIDFNDVFSQDVFHEGGVLLRQSIEEGDEGSSGTDEDDAQAEADPLISNVASYGSSDGKDGGSSNQFPPRQARRKQGKKISLSGALCWLLRNSYIIRFAIPLAAVAWILVLVFKNHTIGAFDISWCFFTARQLAVVDVARILRYLLVDCLFIKNAQYFKFFGPLLTLIAIQSKGWPLLLFFWGLIDMALFHHGVAVDEDALNAEVYLQTLVCLVIAGALTAVKRVLVVITFGCRQYRTFAARLDSILADVVLLNEIATLASNADSIRHQVIDSRTVQQKTKRDRGLFQVRWSCIRKDSVTPVGFGDDEDDNNEDTDASAAAAAASELESKISFSPSTSSRKMAMEDLLHNWEEPETQEENKVSIQDVLLFRRALSFMDEQFPFGVDFGPASNRDECVQSSTKIFDELCKLSSTAEERVEFSILALLAESENGERDDIKRATLHRLFRPHTDGCLTRFMFVQSCDNLFRRLTYFRASVQNSSSLDQVLEGMINGIYYFVLAMFLLSVLRFDPWSLLLSITSLLVSFSFAFGPTISKYVHGIIMIAVHRPFDLGDRVYLAPSGSIETGAGNFGASWFVEELNLGVTKLRYAKTGETAYIQNSLLSEMRIYNLNRTSSALVLFELNFHISILDNNNLQQFKEALKNYIKEHPRRWESLDFITCDKIVTDMEQAVFCLGFRHRNNWQDAAIIAIHRSDLLKFMVDASKKLGIADSSPVLRQVLFMGSKMNNAKVDSPGPSYTNVESADDIYLPQPSGAIDVSQVV